MSNPIRDYAADHRYLMQVMATEHGFVDPVAIDLDEFRWPLMKEARRIGMAPLDGVLIRDWDPDFRRHSTGVTIGLRLYEIDGIRFGRICFMFETMNANPTAFDFAVVAKADYIKLYRIAVRCRRDSEPPSPPPVLKPAQRDTLWQNTIGYLDPVRLKRIREYGGRPKRGLLLTGPPGNGKTSACRWIWQECRRRRWEWRLVSPDAYAAARGCSNAVEAVRALFTVEKRGVIFFDDMDIALRDRNTVKETDDQAVFLGALDGIEVKEGTVFVFTTNCSLDLIDSAFKRPGRIDLVLEFQAPDADLRSELISRWHKDILLAINLAKAVASTEGMSFAEIEELKNLLIIYFMDHDVWDWDGALKQLAVNRDELNIRHRRNVGFAGVETNGVKVEN